MFLSGKGSVASDGDGKCASPREKMILRGREEKVKHGEVDPENDFTRFISWNLVQEAIDSFSEAFQRSFYFQGGTR